MSKMNYYENSSVDRFRLDIRKHFKNSDWSFSENDIEYLLKRYRLTIYKLSQIISEEIVQLGLSFPYWSEIITDSKEQIFERLVNYKLEPVIMKDYSIRNFKECFITDVIKKEFDGEQLVFVSRYEDFKKINVLSNFYSEVQRLECKRIHKKYSPIESWQRVSELKKVINYIITEKKEINKEKIRDECFYSFSECNNFRLTTAKIFYEYFEANKILDISAGWGDRLLGAIAWSKVNKNFLYYHGVDPNINMVETYVNTIKDFTDDEDSQKFELFITPFENLNVKDHMKYDMIFTSPPYYDLEDFTYPDISKGNNENISNQSIAVNKNLESWTVNFLLHSLIKAFSMLEKNGHMVINMEDSVGYETSSNYVESVILAFNGLVNDSVYLGMLPVGLNKYSPFFVWKKVETGVNNLKERKKNLELLKKHYPEFFKLILEKCEA